MRWGLIPGALGLMPQYLTPPRVNAMSCGHTPEVIVYSLSKNSWICDKFLVSVRD